MSIGNTSPQHFTYPDLAYLKGVKINCHTLKNGQMYTFKIPRLGQNLSEKREPWSIHIKNDTGKVLYLNRPQYFRNEANSNFYSAIVIDASTSFFKCGMGLYSEDLAKIVNVAGSISCMVVPKENLKEGIKFIPKTC